MRPAEESFNPQRGHDPLAENHCSKGHPQPCKTGGKCLPHTDHYCPLQRENPTELSLPYWNRNTGMSQRPPGPIGKHLV